MAFFNRFVHQEWFRSLALAIVIIGVALSLFSAARYADLSFRIAGNASFQVRQAGGQAALQTETDARMLMSADLQLRELESDRNTALIAGGIGLVILAVGWLGYDMSRARKTAPNVPRQSPAG
jgi:uncharacterized membrane protein YidH (DUF202 family)